MWVCWYGNDLNKQKSFPSGKNNFASCSFSFFLPLSLNDISILFPSRCRAMEGEEGMRFCCPYLTSVSVVYMKIRTEGVRCEAGCHGWLWRDAWHHGHVPTMWQGAGAGQEGRECSGERMMPRYCLPAEQWWWWPPVQPGGRRMVLSAGKCSVICGSWQASMKAYFHEISNTKCSWVMEVFLKSSVVFQEKLDWEHS